MKSKLAAPALKPPSAPLEITRTFTAPPLTAEQREMLAEVLAEARETRERTAPIFRTNGALLQRAALLESEINPPERIDLVGKLQHAHMAASQGLPAQAGAEQRADYEETQNAFRAAAAEFEEYQRGPGLELEMHRHGKLAMLTKIYGLIAESEVAYNPAIHEWHCGVLGMREAISRVVTPAASEAVTTEIMDAIRPFFFDENECRRFALQSPVHQELRRRFSPYVVGRAPESMAPFADEAEQIITELLAGSHRYTITARRHVPPVIPSQAEALAAMEVAIKRENAEVAGRQQATDEKHRAEQERHNRYLRGEYDEEDAPAATA